MGQHGGGVPGGGAERMTTKELVLSIMRSQGAADALDLRSRAPDLDGTAIIAEEAKVPQFDGTKDYSGWAIGLPRLGGGQRRAAGIHPAPATQRQPLPREHPIQYAGAVVDPAHQRPL